MTFGFHNFTYALITLNMLTSGIFTLDAGSGMRTAQALADSPSEDTQALRKSVAHDFNGAVKQLGVSRQGLPCSGEALPSVGASPSDDCRGLLSQPEEVALLQETRAANEQFLSGLISAEARDLKVNAIIHRIAVSRPARKLGMAKVIASQALTASAAPYVLKLALKYLSHSPITAAEKAKLKDLGVHTQHAGDYIVAVANRFKPDYQAMLAAGAHYEPATATWNLERASVSALHGDPQYRRAIETFFGKEFAHRLADPARTTALVYHQQVFYPPTQHARVENLPEHKKRVGYIHQSSLKNYNLAAARAAQSLTREIGEFVSAAKAHNSIWNVIRDAGTIYQSDAEKFGTDAQGQALLPPELATQDAAYNALLAHLATLRKMGVPADQYHALAAEIQKALQGEHQAIDRADHIVGMMELGTAAAPFVPLIIAAAPFVAASAGVVGVTGATASATAAGAALFPMAFALGGSVLQAGISAAHGQGSFSCNFADEFLEKGPNALALAPFSAAVPLVGLAAAGVAGGSALVYGGINLVTAAGFLGAQGWSLAGDVPACYRRITAAMKTAHTSNHELATAQSLEAQKFCAQVGVDLAFAAVGAKHFAKGAFEVGGGSGGGKGLKGFSPEDTSRLARAETELGRKVSTAQKKAIIEAHESGRGQPGKRPGSHAGINADGTTNYTQAQLRAKYRILKKAGFSAAEIRALMDKQFVGDAVPEGETRPAQFTKDGAPMSFDENVRPGGVITLTGRVDGRMGGLLAYSFDQSTHTITMETGTGVLLPTMKNRGIYRAMFNDMIARYHPAKIITTLSNDNAEAVTKAYEANIARGMVDPEALDDAVNQSPAGRVRISAGYHIVPGKAQWTSSGQSVKHVEYVRDEK